MLMYDLCCGEGGVTQVALDQGWDVVGVDIKPQPNYPGEFILGDALRPPLKPIADLVWVSPPCQGYSRTQSLTPKQSYPLLVHPLRKIAQFLGKHFIIENVQGCKDLINPIRLCGAMFGLPLVRHRLFETSFLVPQPPHFPHPTHRYTIAGHQPGLLEKWRQAMGLPHLTRYGLTQAVPYAYTSYLLSWYKTSRI